jgi:hypothetical protein
MEFALNPGNGGVENYYYYSNFLFNFKYGIQYYGIDLEKKNEVRIRWRKQGYDS